MNFVQHVRNFLNRCSITQPIQLRLQPGDVVQCMTLHRDNLIVASRHGYIYILEPSAW